jgi:hypothetical protein
VRSNGGFIGAKKTVSTAAASGIWAIRDAQREKGANNWPTDFGLTANNPATSPAHLRSNGITTDGVYWFSTTQQPTPFQTYVKFNFIDGGDWSLLLKVHNRGDMPSGSAFWTNTTLNNASDFNLTSGNWSKYATWNGVAFTRLAMEMAGRIPPIMIFNTSRTFAAAMALTTTSTNNGGLRADSTDPAFGAGAGHDYSNSSAFPMKVGINFTRQSGGAEGLIQGYGINVWANNASNSTTSIDGFSSTGIAGARIGAPMDEGTHTFNNASNIGSDSGFGFGATAGNTARTTSSGYIEWASGQTTDTLPGYVWVR